MAAQDLDSRALLANLRSSYRRRPVQSCRVSARGERDCCWQINVGVILPLNEGFWCGPVHPSPRRMTPVMAHPPPSKHYARRLRLMLIRPCSACMRAKIAPALSSLLGAVFIYLAALRDRPAPPFRGCNDIFREFATGHSDMGTFWASYSCHEHVAGWVVSTLLRRRTHHMPASSIAALTRGDCCTGTHRSPCFNLQCA